MKLANALSQRAELQTRIHQLETRLYNNAQVQEGESPAEDPQDLLQELEEDYARLEALIACINRTNCCTLVDGVPLSDLLARREFRPITQILRAENFAELFRRASPVTGDRG